MHASLSLLLLLAGVASSVWSEPAYAGRRTVCTITVNSADERNAFREALPASRYDFVELVERGRPDWLESACRRGVRCDVLVVSGHFNGNDFFSDRLDVDEFLPVEEMERASCSHACPALFSQLREAYLFGCTTLSPDSTRSTAGEIARTLARSGHVPGEAQRLAAALREAHGESHREVMRRIFANVPAIYGFSAVAPLGPVAGPLLRRYFRASGGAEIGNGRLHERLLATFAAHGMTMTPGLRAGDRGAEYREDVCRLIDEHSTAAHKLRTIHAILERDVAEARFFLERIERTLGSFPDGVRADDGYRRALAEIGDDRQARTRFLAYAHATTQPAVRARMVRVARALAWLSDREERDEMAALVRELLASRTVRTSEVDLACSLAERYALGDLADSGDLASTANAAVLACLGDRGAHARVLAALAEGRDPEVVAIYLRHRSFTPTELRTAIAAIGGLADASAQARALEVLARHGLAEPDALDALVGLYPKARTAEVQRAIAGILVRSDYRAIAAPEVLAVLRNHRLPSPAPADIIDILIRRLEGATLEQRQATAGGEARARAAMPSS